MALTSFRFSLDEVRGEGHAPITASFPSLNGNANTLLAAMAWAVSNEQKWLARDLHW